MTAPVRAIQRVRSHELNESQKENLNSQTSSRLDELKKHKEQIQADRKAEIENSRQSSDESNAVIRERNEAQTDSQQLYNRQGAMNMKVHGHTEAPVEYIDMKADNFYKAIDRGNLISEDSTGYYIDAFAPEGEKDNTRISISHDRAVVSGSRKANNEYTGSEKKITTNNFQTYREEFTFAEPVDAKGITRERDGNYIRFFIPKTGKNS